MKVQVHTQEIDLNVVNPDDKDYYDRLFAVSLAKQTLSELVWASNTQEALDIYADYAESQGWWGLFLDHEREQDLAQYSEVSYLGNHSRPVWDDDIFVKEVTLK